MDLTKIFGRTDPMSPMERKAAIDAGIMTPEDFRPVVEKPVVAPSRGFEPSTAQKDLAKSLNIPVEVLIQRQDAQRDAFLRARQGKAGGGLIEGGLGRLAKLLRAEAKPASRGVMDVVRDVPIHAGGPAVTARSFEGEDYGALIDQLAPFGKAKALQPDNASIFDQMLDNASENISAVTHVTLDASGRPHAAMQVAPRGTAQDDADYLAYLVSLNGGKGAGTQAVEHLKNNSGAISAYPSHSALGFWDKLMTRDPRWGVVVGDGDNVDSLLWKADGMADGGAVKPRNKWLTGAGRNGSYNEESPLAVLKGLASMLGSAGRGVAATTLGLPGDMTRLGYMLTGNEQPAKGQTLLPDTSDMRRMLPNLPLDMRSSAYESLGSQVPLTPGQLGKLGGAAGLGGAELLARGMESSSPLASMMTAALRPMGVIKPKGGQWLAGSVEGALKGLKRTDLTYPEGHPGKAINEALNNWVDGPLTKYVKRDMGTVDDPIVKLADQGIQTKVPDYGPTAAVNLARRREQQGQNPAALGNTDAGKAWSNTIDSLIGPQKAGAAGKLPYMLEENPWLSKVDPNTPVYSVSDDVIHEAGLGHMLDEMSNALGTDLPEHLRIDPKALASGNFSVDAAVRRVHDINKWRAAMKAEADQARANNAATVLHKEYPDDPKGLRWVQLKKLPHKVSELPAGEELRQQGNDLRLYQNGEPTNSYYSSMQDRLDHLSEDESFRQLQDALKYEGDTMGHCVGGYCEEVAIGNSDIYSLRDAKGQPHVTIEARADGKLFDGLDRVNDVLEDIGWYITDAEKAAANARLATHDLNKQGIYSVDDYIKNPPDGSRNTKYIDQDEVREFGLNHLKAVSPEAYTRLMQEEAARTLSIVQIKGKGNAKPHDDYLPYVQDFVKSGQWSDVGDLENTGLIRHTGKRAKALGQFSTDEELTKYLDQFPDQNFAKGGLVDNSLLELYGYN